jgi:putative sigma-54 modulation protein
LKIIVSARHFDLSPALKGFADEKLKALKKYFDQVIEVDLVLSVDEHRSSKKDIQTAEATLWANGAVLHGKARTEDMYASIQAVVDKLEKQLKRYKQKLRDNRKRRGRGRSDAPPPAPEFTHAVVEVSPESDTSPKLVRESDFVLQPLTVEEASLQLSEFGRDFVVFSNIDTNALGVVYRRLDGDVGWIEAKSQIR